MKELQKQWQNNGGKDMIDISEVKDVNLYVDTDSFKVIYKLGHDEKLCLKHLLSLYQVVVYAHDDAKNDEARAVACSMIKEFLGYCFLKNQISKEDMEYIHKMDIISPISGHKAFLDILTRKYINEG